MRAQQHVGVVLDEKGVLHIASGVIFREIQGGEDMPIVLDFRPFRDAESKSPEDVADFFLYK